jgi:HPt (histidine-containing phosphotransfer) domain-containing protein
MITVRLPEPLHQRYRRVVRTLAGENDPTSVTELVHALLANAPTAATDMRTLVRRWRALLDAGLDEAPSHPYTATGKRATTLRVEAGLRDRATRLIRELEEQRFRTNLNEIIQALMHFGPDNAAEARRLLARVAVAEPAPPTRETGGTSPSKDHALKGHD